MARGVAHSPPPLSSLARPVQLALSVRQAPRAPAARARREARLAAPRAHRSAARRALGGSPPAQAPCAQSPWSHLQASSSLAARSAEPAVPRSRANSRTSASGIRTPACRIRATYVCPEDGLRSSTSPRTSSRRGPMSAALGWGSGADLSVGSRRIWYPPVRRLCGPTLQRRA